MRGWRVSLILCAVAGCGLSDYEKRMDEQRERLKLFDEESANLYEIIDMPSGKDAYGNVVKSPFDVYLRLPVGFAGKFEGAKSIYTSEKLPLYRFSSSKADVNVLVAWSKLAEKNPKDPAKQEGLLPEEFRARVRGALVDYISRAYSVSANPPELTQLTKDTRPVQRDGMKRNLEFETTEFVDSRQNRYLIFLQEWGDRQAAVIYQAPAQPPDQKLQRMFDMSIKTLDITSAATAERNKFRSRPRA